MAKYPGPIAFAAFTGPSSPMLVDGGSNDKPATGQVACKKTWGITELTLSAGGKTSTSFDDRGHTAVDAGRDAAGRFYFAPKSDDVTVSWKLKNPDNAGTLKLELFAAGNGVPIWQRTLSADDAQKLAFDDTWDGSFPSGEWIATAKFPDELVTVEHSPYMLKATAEGSPEEGFVERWTYFDILVAKLEIRGGGPARIPPGAPAGVVLNYATRTQSDERQILLSLLRASATLASGLRFPVKLPSNQFPRTVDEQKNDSMFAGHRDQWGDGPRIPLIAKIWIRAAGDGEIFAGETAKALGKAKFLWDWESEDEIANLAALYPTAAVQDFLRDTLDYKRNDGRGPPDSTNCHADHGGKRGGTTTVFPAAGAPFPVTACAIRVWAVTTEAGLTGADKGLTGVIFQPSRMSRDSYKVSVYLASEKAGGGAPELDQASSAADLRQDHPELPSCTTGVFEIQRVVRARYIRKAPVVEAADLVLATTEYARAKLVLDWVPGLADEQAFQNDYNEYFARIIENRLHNEGNVAEADFKKPAADLVRAVTDAFEGIDQFAGGSGAGVAPAFTAHVWGVFLRKQKILAIRDYVLNKPRKINGPKRKYNAWRANHALADDSQWLLDFYDDLSKKRKAKVDLALQNALLARNIETAKKYLEKLQTASMQGFKVIGGQHLNATDEDGFICFHCFDSIQLRRSNGTFVEAPSSVGGLAPSDSTSVSRKKAMNLMYLPQTVPMDRIGVPNVYDVSVSPIIKHEIGHNFYLIHAPAAPDAPREAGGFRAEFHDAADMLCLMNYDTRSDHLCGMCNVRLRGWAAKAASGAGFVDLSNDAALNKNP